MKKIKTDGEHYRPLTSQLSSIHTEFTQNYYRRCEQNKPITLIFFMKWL